MLAVLFKFFMGSTGRWVAIGIALLVWTTYQREQAASKAREQCQTEQLRKTLEEIARQRDAARQALDEAEKQAMISEREMSDLERERDRLIAEQKQAPADRACIIPDSTRKRLRNIK